MATLLLHQHQQLMSLSHNQDQPHSQVLLCRHLG
jgi:hypothetical protein